MISITFLSVNRFDSIYTLKDLVGENSVIQKEILRLETLHDICPYTKYNDTCPTVQAALTKHIQQLNEIAERKKSSKIKKKELLVNTQSKRKPRELPSFIDIYSSVKAVQDYIAVYNSESRWPEEAKELNSYKKYKLIEIDLDNKLTAATKELDLFSRSNFSFPKAVEATFIHGGWLHLFGNLLILVIFGVFVEQRIGSIKTILLFFFTSLLGLSTELQFLSPGTPIMGASAGLMGVVGAFFIFFFRAKIKFIFSFFFLHNRTYFFPVLYSIPVFYVGGDLVGILSRDLKISSVAHIAHFAGFLSGAMIAYVIKKSDKLPSGVLFKQEFNLVNKYLTTPQIEKKISILNEIFYWNFQHQMLIPNFLNDLNTFQFKLESKRQPYIYAALRKYFSDLSSNGDHKMLSEWFHLYQDVLDLEQVTKKLLWQDLIKLADHNLKLGRTNTALNIYVLVLNRSNLPRYFRSKLAETCTNLRNLQQDSSPAS